MSTRDEAKATHRVCFCSGALQCAIRVAAITGGPTTTHRKVNFKI